MKYLRILVSLVLLLVVGYAARVPTFARAAAPVQNRPLALRIDTEGIYHLTYNYLRSHHLHPSHIDVRKLGLSESGTSVPIYVFHQGAGHAFGGGDYIEFYAHPVNNTYTSTNTYVLTDDGSHKDRVSSWAAKESKAPQRVAANTYIDQQRTARLNAGPLSSAYTTSIAWPSTGDPIWKETDLLTYSGQPTTSSGPISFSLASPVKSGACHLTVPVTGYPDTTSSNTPAYNLTIGINGSPVINPNDQSASFTWQGGSGGLTDYTAATNFPCSDLNASTALSNGVRSKHRLRSAAEIPTSQQVSFGSSLTANTEVEEVMPQSFKIAYRENLCALNGQLEWHGSPSTSYAVADFTSPHIVVWRISGTHESRVKRLKVTHKMSACASHSGYGTTVGIHGSAAGQYFATSKPLTPAGASPLDLKSITTGGANSAQYLIVTSSQFVKGVKPLAAYHRSHGLTTKIVTTNAIYDQYQQSRGSFSASTSAVAAAGDGQLNPDAIRAYIQFAVTHLGTQYVLLAGGDTFDYHNYYNCPTSGLCSSSSNPNNVSIVPSLYSFAVFGGEAQSDNLFAVPLGAANDAPDVAIGRLPAVTPAQLDTEVARTIHWPQDVAGYAHTATFIADPVSTACADPVFSSASDHMSQELPSGFSINKTYVNSEPISTMSATTLSLTGAPPPTLVAGTSITLTGSPTHGTFSDTVQSISSTSPWTVTLQAPAPSTDFTDVTWSISRAQAQASAISLIDRGQEIVNYTGHGNLTQWTCLPLTASDVSQLNNVNKPFVAMQWGCEATLLGARLPSMDALLMNATNAKGQATGAVAAIGSSGEDLAEPQADLAGGEEDRGPSGTGYFYGYLSRGDSIGLALERAKDDMIASHGSDPNSIDVVNSYRVLGDPDLILP